MSRIEQAVPAERSASERAKAFRASIEARAIPDLGIDLGAEARRLSAEQRYEQAEYRRWAAFRLAERELIEASRGVIPVARIRRLQICVAKFYEVEVGALISQMRHEPLVTHRHIAIYFAREELQLSWPALGRKFGGRDHSTAIHAHRKISARRLIDGDFSDELDRLAAIIRVELAGRGPACRALLLREHDAA